MERDFDADPLTQREMRIYLCLLQETVAVVQEADLLAAKIRAAEIIKAHEGAGGK